MNSAVRVDDLQNALVARAKALADQYLLRARRDREALLADAQERVKLREEREQLAAKASGERAYRQRVQAEELKLRADMDRLRWVHVQAVMDALQERLKAFADSDPEYDNMLRRFILRAGAAIEATDLVVQLNTHDYARLRDNWEAFLEEGVKGKTLTLSAEPKESIGGAMVSSKDNTIRVDTTFEGRIARYETELEQAIIERLFAGAAPMGAIFNG